jgi:hypothetical protein
MLAGRIAPGRRRAHVDLNPTYIDASSEMGEGDLRSQVEHKFVEMSETHDRIRGEFLQSQRQKRTYPGRERSRSIFHV